MFYFVKKKKANEAQSSDAMARSLENVKCSHNLMRQNSSATSVCHHCRGTSTSGSMCIKDSWSCKCSHHLSEWHACNASDESAQLIPGKKCKRPDEKPVKQRELLLQLTSTALRSCDPISTTSGRIPWTRDKEKSATVQAKASNGETGEGR